jgi:hypothetical protein
MSSEFSHVTNYPASSSSMASSNFPPCIPPKDSLFLAGLTGALCRLRLRLGPGADSSLVLGRLALGGAAPGIGAPGLVM